MPDCMTIDLQFINRITKTSNLLGNILSGNLEA